ncbi:protein disulfide-isomerase precursor [Podila epigama]|nr:protein disulfide-isomerase precursor [Podila epigama]
MRLSSALALVGLAATSLFAGVQAESDVLELNQKNFASTVDKENLILVEFFAPWCGHCKALAPEYEIAATELKSINIPVAKVDCTVETTLCQEQGIQGYPTLKVFRNGNSSEYPGPRKADGIVSYLKKQNQPALTILSAETAADFSASDKVVIIGVLPADSEKREILLNVAERLRDDYTFGVVEESADLKTPGIVLYKKFDEGKNTNGVPIMDEIGPNNYASYMESGLPLGYFFFSTPEQRAQYGAEIEALAKELRGKMNFVYIDGTKFGAHASNLNLKENWPAFGIQNVKNGAKYPVDQADELTIEKIKAVATGVLDGSLEPSIKSEAIPESNDGPVKVVVADSYKEIVENQDKDVLIEFYAPWCGHCKNLAPIYEDVGKLYQGSDIVIAKIDATANDLPASVPFQIEGFPTIKFRKAGSTEYIDYKGERTKEAFISFLNEHAVNKFDVKIPEEEKPVQAEDIEHDEL